MAGRKLRSYKSSGALDVVASLLRSRLATIINYGILLLLFLTASTLIFHQGRYISLHIRTVAGDNLRPTPWHKFPLEELDKWGRTSRLPTILKCNYLSCLGDILSPIRSNKFHSNSADTCPSFFQWIYEDLSPWKQNGVTVENLKAAQQHAAFRVVIVGGRLYTEFYYACVLPRVLFTLWGLLQLLEKYPGIVPDVDLMFDCMDRPSVKKAHFRRKSVLPPLFRYCGDKNTFDIPFPDWSFWGWPQIDITSWTDEMQSIYSSSKLLRWEDRKPNAYWKGNPYVGSKLREELLKCNKTKERDWGAEIYRQDWLSEGLNSFKNSKLSQQCKHRYKIYTEGHAWSVSFKYILACNSPVLVASPTYHEFYTRGLIPMVHYWPIQRNKLCSSIKFAVNWSNNHPEVAKAMGNAAQEFLWRNLTMDHVYDYMFHLLSEYAKLQKFKPVVPSTARLLCKKALYCFTDDPKSKAFLKASEAKASSSPPCTMTSLGHAFVEDVEKMGQDATTHIWKMEDMENSYDMGNSHKKKRKKAANRSTHNKMST